MNSRNRDAVYGPGLTNGGCEEICKTHLAPVGNGYPRLGIDQVLPLRKDLNISYSVPADRQEECQLIVRGGLYRPS